MRWYEEYAKECFEDCWYKDDDDCWHNDDRYSSDCLYCDYFHEYLTDMDMFNERIDYCDFDSECEYKKAVEFANYADDIICDEEGRWWWGFRGVFDSIRAGAVDPRDFDNEEAYTSALHDYLFGEIIDRFPFIPDSDSWRFYFSECIEETDSVPAATQLLLEHYEDLYDTEVSIEQLLMMSKVSPILPNNKERKFQKPARTRWNYFRKRWEYDWCDDGIIRNGRACSKKQFLIEVCTDYPEISRFISMDKILEKFSEEEIEDQDYYFDVIRYALYFHELFNFNLEDAIQDGVLGLRRALNNGFWRNHFGFMDHEEYIRWEIRVNIVRYSLQSQNIFGYEPDRETAKQLEYYLCGVSQELFDKELEFSFFGSKYRFNEWRNLEEQRIDFIDKFKNAYRYTDLPQTIEKYSQDLDLLDCIPLFEIEDNPTEELCMVAERNRILLAAVESLPEKYKTAVQLRYGLDGYEQSSLEEIGQYYMVSRERIRQIVLKAIELMKKTEPYVKLCYIMGFEDRIPTFARMKKFDIPVKEAAPEEWNYDVLRNKTICITDYKGERTHIVIPQRIDNYPVTALGDFFLSPDKPYRRKNRKEVCRNIQSVVIPEGVLKIGESAFENCESLKEIIVPDTVTEISKRAFANTAVNRIHMPFGLKELGRELFDGCDSIILTNFENALYCGTTENPYEILLRAEHSKIEKCTIHKDTKVIYDYAFHNCIRLSMLDLPDNIVYICEYAFSNCKLSLNEYENGLYLGNSKNPHLTFIRPRQWSTRTIHFHPETKIVYPQAFANCSYLSKIFVPASVQQLPWIEFKYTRPRREIITSKGSYAEQIAITHDIPFSSEL